MLPCTSQQAVGENDIPKAMEWLFKQNREMHEAGKLAVDDSKLQVSITG